MVSLQDRARAELELRRRRRDTGDRPSPKLAHIPERWEDFAVLTRIRSGTQMIPFEPFEYQRKISDLIDRTRGVVIVKPRQHGLTELVASKFLHKACRFPTYFAAVFSKGQDDTANIARRVRLMAASAKIPLASNNVKDIAVEGGGRIVFRTASPDSGRGLESVWDILYDEAAFVNAIEQIYGASTPAQSLPEQQGKAHTILLSTPNAKQGLYYETLMSGNGDRSVEAICHQMREGEIEPYQEWIDEQNWGKAIIHWMAHPVHSKNPNYLHDVKEAQKITEAQLQREYNLSFDDSTGGNLFNVSAIHACATGQWKQPEPGKTYLVGIDPNFGGDDRFVCQVWSIGDVCELVAEYAESQRSVDSSITQSLKMIDSYKPRIVAVEGNSGGRVVLEQLSKLRRSVRFEQVITTRTSKIANTDRIAIAVEQGTVRYPKDWAGISEMVNFSLREREAIAGNDDRVMAWAVGFALLDEVLGRAQGSITQTQSAIW